MRYLAVVLLAVLGLVEFIVRAAFCLCLVVTIIGLVVLIYAQENKIPILEPGCWEMAGWLLDEPQATNKHVERLTRENVRLQTEKSELQTLLVAADRK